MKHIITVAILVVVATILTSALLDNIGLLPVGASQQAVSIDQLLDLHFKLIAFLFSLIMVFMLYSVVVFKRKPGDMSDAKHIEGHTGLELFWTAMPLAIVLYLSYLGAQSLAETRRVDPQAMVVKVTARQWSWLFEYPQYDIASTTLNLPVNKQVLFQVESQDVIHGFWVPEFRVKQDVLPGMMREMRVTPIRLGEYKVRCSVICGTSHALMEQSAIVQSDADFQAWVTDQQKAMAASPVERGKRWSAQFGCAACHSVDGKTLVGPTWKGLYNSKVEFADGTSATADDAYLKESILNPNAKQSKGFLPNVMPANFGQTIKPEQINDLLEYIKSLK
ncbi:MAG: cytochrome c oxidase subunit II [Chloroflexi bacterium]|nr:cytochrome c oxidase subunit II [Chloroflexota bacterium]